MYLPGLIWVTEDRKRGSSVGLGERLAARVKRFPKKGKNQILIFHTDSSESKLKIKSGIQNAWNEFKRVDNARKKDKNYESMKYCKACFFLILKLQVTCSMLTLLGFRCFEDLWGEGSMFSKILNLKVCYIFLSLSCQATTALQKSYRLIEASHQ